jgi:hypothetical protein
MRSIALLTILGLLVGICAVSAQDTKVNFSGEWILNADKSEQGGGGGGGRGMGSSKLIVKQEDTKLAVESFRQNRDGEEVSTVSNYTLDGKECENEARFGKQISVVNWSKDGKTLVIESESTMSRNGEEMTFNSKEEWTLDKDTLTIHRTMSSSRGDRESKTVYDRAKKE